MTDDDDVQRVRRYIVDEDLTREQFEALFPPQFSYAYEPLFSGDFRPAGVRQILTRQGQFRFLDIETGRFVSTERVLGRPLGETMDEETDSAGTTPEPEEESPATGEDIVAEEEEGSE